MSMSGVQWFIIGMVFTSGIGYVSWFLWSYAGFREMYYLAKKKKEIDLAVKILRHCGDNEDLKIITLIKYGVVDPVIVRLADKKFKEVKNGNEISKGKSRGCSGQEGEYRTRDSDVAGQRNIQEGVVREHKRVSEYFG